MPLTYEERIQAYIDGLPREFRKPVYKLANDLAFNRWDIEFKLAQIVTTIYPAIIEFQKNIVDDMTSKATNIFDLSAKAHQDHPQDVNPSE